MYLIALYISEKLGMVTSGEYVKYISEIEALPERAEEILKDKNKVQYREKVYKRCCNV